MNRIDQQDGFTLIELMIALVIAAIVLAVGVPSFQGMMRTNRTAAQANEFGSALSLARSEAAKRGRNMVLCPSTDQASCTGGTNWASGWLLYVDNNGNGAIDGADTVFRVWGKLSGNPTFSGPNQLAYRPTGDIVGGTTQFAYTVDEKQLCIRVNAVGRSHIDKEASCS